MRQRQWAVLLCVSQAACPAYLIAGTATGKVTETYTAAPAESDGALRCGDALCKSVKVVRTGEVERSAPAYLAFLGLEIGAIVGSAVAANRIVGDIPPIGLEKPKITDSTNATLLTVLAFAAGLCVAGDLVSGGVGLAGGKFTRRWQPLQLESAVHADYNGTQFPLQLEDVANVAQGVVPEKFSLALAAQQRGGLVRQADVLGSGAQMGTRRKLLPTDNLLVLDFENGAPQRISRDEALALSDSFRSLAHTVGPALHVTTKQEVFMILGEGGVAQCEEQGLCAVQRGIKVNSDEVIEGRLALVAGKVQLTLKLWDTRTPGDARATEVLDGDKYKDFADQLPGAAARLLSFARQP